MTETWSVHFSAREFLNGKHYHYPGHYRITVCAPEILDAIEVFKRYVQEKNYADAKITSIKRNGVHRILPPAQGVCTSYGVIVSGMKAGETYKRNHNFRFATTAPDIAAMVGLALNEARQEGLIDLVIHDITNYGACYV
jgi:hypothetical protein